VRAIATPNVNLPLVLPAKNQSRVDKTHLVIDVSQPVSRDSFGRRLGEWFEIGALIALIGMAVVALSIPVLLVVVSIVNILSGMMGRIS
jgi:hypothetical protein